MNVEILDAEQLLKDSLEKVNEEETDADVLTKAYFTLVRCLLDMKRNERPMPYMQKAEKYSTRAVFDKWGYLFIQLVSGRRQRNNLSAQQHKDCEELATYSIGAIICI